MLQLREDVPELHALGNGLRAAAGNELAVEVRRAQAKIFEVEHARPRTLHQPQGIKLGYQMAAVSPDLNEARDGRLLCIAGAGSDSRGRIRHAQACKILPPARLDACRVAQ